MKMLWWKAWRETRLRVVFASVLMLWVVGALIYAGYGPPRHPYSAETLRETAQSGFGTNVPGFIWWKGYVLALGISWLVIGPMLAGAGVNSQTTYGLSRGVHPSMLFTLALPVRRRDLVLTRSLWGAAVSFLVILVPGLLLPLLSRWLTFAPMRFVDAFVYTVMIYLAGMVFYWVSVLCAAILDEQWQLYAAWAICGAVLGLANSAHVPLLSRLLELGMSTSWVRDHTVPWTTIAVCLVISTGLLITTLRIVDRREY